MKKTNILFVVLLVSIFFISKDIVAQENRNEEKFAKDFIEAIKSKDIDEVLKLKPSVALWREIMPEETKEMSDDDLIYGVNKTEKFVGDFGNIMASAKEENIDLNKILYKNISLKKMWEGENSPYGLVVSYKYEKKEGTFDLSVIKYKENFYLSEILISYDCFYKLKHP